MNHFYFDLGYGNGNTIKEFLQGDITPLSCSVEEWQIIGYEPTPWNNSVLETLHAEFPLANIILHEKAAWIKDGDISLSVVHYRDDSNTVIPQCSNYSDETSKKVPCINFSDVLKNLCTLEDEVIVKMDIEGAEYSILEHLLISGTIKLVSHLFVEFHDFILPFSFHQRQSSIIERCPVPLTLWSVGR